MTNETDVAGAGWFSDTDPEDVDAASEAITDGRAEEPREWPRIAVETGYADSETDYFDRLHEAATHAARQEVREREGADDRQLIHSVRAMDDCQRTANELAERVAEWAGSRVDDAGTGVDYARELAAQEPADPSDAPLVSLAQRAADLADEADALRKEVERTAPDVAPNLAALAGPVLAARLLSQAGGLEALAKLPSGTVQVLGAEDALFAHLQGGAPAPKHGVIYTHEAVQGMAPDTRGSAARALAGKLSIAARVDHYSGDRRPELEADLASRIERLRERGDS